MKAKTITVILILLPVSVLAQHKFLPVIDSTVACSFGEVGHATFKYNMPNPFYEYKAEDLLEIFYIVEEMPEPKIPVIEIESMLERSTRLNAQEMTYHGNIYLQCIVNCRGQAGDYQINHCAPEFVNIGYQVLNVFREWIINWDPPVQRDRSVDLLTKVKVTIDQGHFEVVAPFY